VVSFPSYTLLSYYKAICPDRDLKYSWPHDYKSFNDPDKQKSSISVESSSAATIAITEHRSDKFF